MAAAAAAAAALPEELIEAILLHFPPDEPAYLFRASLVCKPWCRLISGPGFRRRYRKFHRSPPLLGFLCGNLGSYVETTGFVPTSPFCTALADLRKCCAIDSHHGRVLLLCPGKALSENVPVGGGTSPWNAAVLCSSDIPCNHLDCRRRPFLVVFVNSHSPHEMFISTYSSDSGKWSGRIFPQHPLDYISISSLPCAHVGNVLYFVSKMSNTALKYDLCFHEMSVIRLPPGYTRGQTLVLTSAEDGGLGCTTVHEFKLCMWSRKDGPQVDADVAGWTQIRVIDLEMLLYSNAIFISPYVVGFANGIGVVFLRVGDMIFTVDLKTKNLKKV